MKVLAYIYAVSWIVLLILIAGINDDEISPLFEKAHDVDNIVLTQNW